MAQNCTIYSNNPNAEHLLNNAKEQATNLAIEVEGDTNNWQAFKYQNKETSMIVKRMSTQDDGDSFANLVEATRSFVANINTAHTDNQSELVELLANSQHIFAITVDPEFDEISEEMVFSMIEAGQAALFTGNEFLNNEGGLILDIEGNSEEGIEAR